MNGNTAFKREMSALLEKEPRINVHRFKVRSDYNGGVVTLDGEVGDVAAKKIALELAAGMPGVKGIVDRLRVEPSEAMEDGEIRDHVCRSLLAEGAFRECGVRFLESGSWEVLRVRSDESAGNLDVEVTDGVVTLNGSVGSLSHMRLAGVLAWWVPGSRDVVNGLEVSPPEEDSDDEVIDAVRMVLEKDPFVRADQIRVGCRDYRVTLEGVVPKPLEKVMAEADAWYVFRVADVVNRLESSE